MNDKYHEYMFKEPDDIPIVSMLYKNVDPDFQIGNIDLACAGELLTSAMPRLIEEFNIYYDNREIGACSEYEFFEMLQSCFDRNADTFERHLEVYNEDIANPVLGRTETITYDVKDEAHSGSESVEHYVEVPADTPDADVDRTRNKSNSKNNGNNKKTGTITTELSDIGVRPNYETMNGFLDKNRTYIQFFVEKFEECFSPRYVRVLL